jgi:hypothetical protein
MKKVIVLLAFLLVTRLSMSQDRYFFLALDANKPLSNTSWINDLSTRGIKIGYRVFINERFSAGLEVSSNAFDQYHPTETVQNATGAITTDYFKYLYSYSATVSGQYYFIADDEERFFPYAGLGLGANNNEYVMYYNIYTDEEVNWGFLVRPEAGILYKFGGRRSIGVMAAVHYNYSTNKSDKFGYNNFNTLGFQVGIVLMER